MSLPGLTRQSTIFAKRRQQNGCAGQAWRRTPHVSFCRPLLHQRRGGLIVSLLPPKQRLEPDHVVIVVERDEVLLTGRERILAFQNSQHVPHRIRRREQ